MKFLGVVHHKMGPQIFVFWLVVIVTAKMLFSLIPWQLSLLEKPYSSAQNQRIKLVNSPSLMSNWLLFLKIKCHKGSFPQWLLRSFDIAIGTKIMKILDFHIILLYYIKIWSRPLFIVGFWWFFFISWNCLYHKCKF